MKSIAIVTNGVTQLGAFLKDNLEEVLAGYVDIRLYALNALAQPARLEEDVVLWMQKNAEAKRGDEIFKGGTIRERRENLEEQDHKGIQIIQGELTRSDGQFFHAAMGSVLQGCLMEWLSPAWAAKLHVQGVRPYSQYVLPLSKGKALWRLAIWQEEAVQELAPRILQQAGRPFFSRQKQCSLTLQVRQVQALTSEDLERRSEALLTAKALRLRFLTPASVRSQNRYMVYPQWPQLMQGLALRRAAAGWEKPPEGLDWEAGMSLLAMSCKWPVSSWRRFAFLLFRVHWNFGCIARNLPGFGRRSCWLLANALVWASRRPSAWGRWKWKSCRIKAARMGKERDHEE